MTTARELIEKLQLQPHPEGGWYRETWRGAIGTDGRSIGTAIHFLLETDQRSHWHTVDAAEIWLWHSGDPLELQLAASEEGPVRAVTLGDGISLGQEVQHVVQPGEWQAAQPIIGDAGYTLVSCVVAPGFEFDGFVLAPVGWVPGQPKTAQ